MVHFPILKRKNYQFLAKLKQPTRQSENVSLGTQESQESNNNEECNYKTNISGTNM